MLTFKHFSLSRASLADRRVVSLLGSAPVVCHFPTTPDSECAQRRFFEGTGVLVLDRINGIAYVALSERADRGLAERWVAEMGYRHGSPPFLVPVRTPQKPRGIAFSMPLAPGSHGIEQQERLSDDPHCWGAQREMVRCSCTGNLDQCPAWRRDLVAFHSTDAAGFPVYHTNVMMAVGTDVAVVCLESVADPKERRHLLASLRRHQEVRHSVPYIPVLAFAARSAPDGLSHTTRSVNLATV